MIVCMCYMLSINVSFFSFCYMQSHFITCTMKFSTTNDIEFMINKWNEAAIKKIISDATADEIRLELVPKTELKGFKCTAV